jgi:hypothetical protein
MQEMQTNIWIPVNCLFVCFSLFSSHHNTSSPHFSLSAINHCTLLITSLCFSFKLCTHYHFDLIRIWFISTWITNLRMQSNVSNLMILVLLIFHWQVSEYIYIWIINTRISLSISKYTYLFTHSFIHSFILSFTHTTGNELGSEGVQSLSEVLKTNTTLVELYLGGKWIYIWIINTHISLSL